MLFHAILTATMLSSKYTSVLCVSFHVVNVISSIICELSCANCLILFSGSKNKRIQRKNANNKLNVTTTYACVDECLCEAVKK